MSRNPLHRLRHTFNDYPRQFWLLIGASYVDMTGGWLLYPFFALYLTDTFGVGLTEVGVAFGLFSVAAIVGSTVGGALSDRWGRKPLLIAGLVTSASSSLSLIFVADLWLFYAVITFLGLFSSLGHPAQQAMVADLLPEEKLAEGYGILRVVMNVAAATGPALGGLIATQSFAYLFVADAVTSLITALIIFRVIAESKPEPKAGATAESLGQTFRGYAVPLRDRIFLLFMLATILANMVYMQLSSTLPVYLRDQHGLAPQFYGLLLTTNASMVVLFQLALTRRLRGLAPMGLMAAGTLLYGLGFGLFGVVSVLAGFFTAIVVLTVGEMIVSPVSQAIVADLAPEALRARYMALAGYAYNVPAIFGPLLAGSVMDNFNPNLVWYGAFGLCLASAGIYWVLQQRVAQRAPLADAGD